MLVLFGDMWRDILKAKGHPGNEVSFNCHRKSLGYTKGVLKVLLLIITLVITLIGNTIVSL